MADRTAGVIRSAVPILAALAAAAVSAYQPPSRAAASQPGPSAAGTYAVLLAAGATADTGWLELIPVAGRAGEYWGRLTTFGAQRNTLPILRARLRGNRLEGEGALGTGVTLVAELRGDSIVGELAGRDGGRVTGRRRAGGVTAELREDASITPFAPGAVSRPDSGESFTSLSPDGRELYFTKHRPNWSGHRIVVSRFDGARWSPPEPLPFSPAAGVHNDREPKLSPDGRRLFFGSDRPAPGDTGRRRDMDVWVVDRGADGRWGAARRLDAPVNTAANEFSPVVTANGTLYFISTREGGVRSERRTHNVWRARPSGASYTPPENLGPAVNAGYETNVYVTPDERLMLVSRDGAPDGFGGDDLYVSQRDGDAWRTMRHLGRPINSVEYEYGPLISPDGRWLFFTSHRRGTADLYRVDVRELGLSR